MNKLFCLFIIILIVFSGYGQVPETPKMFQEHFGQFRHQEFQEKVYLHTDKSFYVAGEQVWFSIYRTDAATHIPSVYSRFVYVELYNEQEELVVRLKVMEQDGCFSGSLPLDRYLPSGRYCLRAYTYWMQNFDEAFYFRKEIVVGNLRTYGMRPEIRFGKTDKGQDYAKIRIRDAGGRIFPGEFLDCRLYRGMKQVRKDIGRIDKEGWVRYPLRRKDSVTGLRVHFLDKKPFEYKANFKLPTLENVGDVDVQFFPEGGNLLAGVPSRVSVKAVGMDGYGVDVYGSVYRDDGELAGSFVSSHRGMGRFILTPESGVHYYALVQLPGGIEKRVDLPAVREEGVILRAEVQDSVIRYLCQFATGYKIEDDLFLLVHSRGVLLAVKPVGRDWSGCLSLKNVPPGIVHGVVMDGTGKIYSECLSFVFPGEKQLVSVVSDREGYGSRDSVRLSLDFLGTDSLTCSLSVTDSLLAPIKQWGMNIANYFLLTSDLKGYIEDPGWYFDSGIPLHHRERMMDLLLSTQGWTRFDPGRICRNERDSLPFFLELSQGLSGRIQNLWGKKIKEGMVYVVAPKINFLKNIVTDTSGRFHLNVLFPDSTTFTFQAFSPRKRKWVELYMDNDSLRPPLGNLLHPERMFRSETEKADPDEMEVSGREGEVKWLSYYYEGNKKIYMLEEAKVIRKKTVYSYLERYENIAGQLLEARDIREEKLQSLEHWFSTIPGVRLVQIGGKTVIQYGLHGSVQLYVNDFNVGELYRGNIMYMLESVKMEDIARLGYVVDLPPFVKSSLTIYIYLKPGCSLFDSDNRLDFIQLTPLGFHESAEFYQPRYEVEEERLSPEPDNRATLYWNPNIRLGKGESKELKFYTSDRKGPFEVVLEGITDQGEIVRVRWSIHSKTHLP